MKSQTTVVRGLAFDVVVVETIHSDSIGTLFYLAAIFVRERKTGVQRLVRRTRIPGTGRLIGENVGRMGIRALDGVIAKFSTTA